MHRVDVFGNSPGVCRKLAEGIESFPGWHKGVRHKKTKTHRKIVRGSRKACRESGWSCNEYFDDGPRYSLGTGPSLEDEVGPRRKFARRFTEGIEKLAGNVKGDRHEENRRTCHKIAGSCRSMQECRWVNRPDGNWTARTIDYERRPMADSG
ncbi:hypothetical protein GW17_00026862 [Ensete ventricosum]|nr:hypothetical protein GW17_00026862 [Ensete ventricosum]